MIIILEGCDKNGKTTLAHKLSQKLGWPIVKFSAPKNDEDVFKTYMQFILSRRIPVILDRFYLGEKVYGQIFRGKSQLDYLQSRTLEGLLLTRRSINVYCQVPLKEIKKNFIKDKESFANVNQINVIVQSYQKVLKSSLLTWHHYDYTKDPSMSSIIFTVKNSLKLTRSSRFDSRLAKTRVVR